MSGAQAGEGAASRAALSKSAHRASWSSWVFAYPAAAVSSGCPSYQAVK